ncbi:MAG: hypothetical protein RSA21_09470 [Akkermansia sp.]
MTIGDPVLRCECLFITFFYADGMDKDKTVKDVADKAAKIFQDMAKTASTIWGKIGYVLIGALIAGISALYLTGCGLTDFTVAGTDGGSLTLKQDPETGKIIVVGQRPQVQGGK